MKALRAGAGGMRLAIALALLSSERAAHADPLPASAQPASEAVQLEPDSAPAQRKRVRGGFALDVPVLAMRLSDVPVLMFGFASSAVLRMPSSFELRVEPGGELLVGSTRAGLQTTYLGAVIGMDFGLSSFHVAPSGHIGVVFLGRASGSADVLCALAPSLGLRLGPELHLGGRNHLALDLTGRAGIAGGMLFAGAGGAVRYGFF